MEILNHSNSNIAKLIYGSFGLFRFIQVGVVHGSLNSCGNKTYPGVYARLSDQKNLEFIKNMMGE